MADTSAWVEYLRGTGSSTHFALRDGILAGSIATTDPVIMELLAGAGSPQREETLAATLARGRYIACSPEDYRVAARIHASCRLAGSPVRNMLDCLIASVAIREAIPMLQCDRDFEAIARNSDLQLA